MTMVIKPTKTRGNPSDIQRLLLLLKKGHNFKFQTKNLDNCKENL